MLLNTLVWACVSGVQADEFLNRDFLTLQEAHQKFWIQGAMDTLIQVAAAKGKEKGQCVANWYYSEKRAERNSLILASMKKYSNEHPSALMLALVEQSCGTFRK